MLQHDDITLQGNELMLIHVRDNGTIHWADENFLRYMDINKIPVIGQHKDVLLKSKQLKIANIIIHSPPNVDRRVEAVDEQGELFEVKITWKENEVHIVIENIDRKKHIKKETVFGKFTLIEAIGRGGTAEVWKARDDDRGMIVAVKMMIAGSRATKVNIKRFLKEAELMKRMNHNNICHIHEVGQYEGVYFISMEYIDGVDLNEYYLSNSFLKDKQKLKIVKDILSAVQHAHDNKIIHRDLKPSNIMMRTNGEPVVMDFGLARIIDSEHTITLEDQVVGTVEYMSPEQAQASAEIDERTDIFSVGAIMYYLMTGQKWFVSTGNIFRDTKLIQTKKLIQPRQLYSNISKRVETIILKAMEKTPRRRYQSAINFLGDIVRYEKNQKIIARPPSLFFKSVGVYKVNKVYFWASFCIITILLLSSALIYGQRLKELATWDLMYQEDFTQYKSPSEISKNWIGYSAEHHQWSKNLIRTFEFTDSSFWRLDSGVFKSDLSKSNIFCANLTFRKRIPGNMRIEWKMKGFINNYNYDAYIAGETRFDGYTFHIGGWDNAQYFVLTKGRDASVLRYSIQDTPLETDREYSFVMEKENKNIRLYMDGKKIFDYFDYNILKGERNHTFGFDNCLKHIQKITEIKVYHQAAAQKISPVAIGDAFFSKEQYQNALEQYDLIAKAYSKTKIAEEALYKKALCLSKLGKDTIALNSFKEFEKAYPSHELVPFSLYERAMIFNKHKDHVKERGLYIKLSKQFPNHPILNPIFFKKGIALGNIIKEIPDSSSHETMVEAINTGLEEVKIWANIFNIDFEKNPFSATAFTELRNLKQYETALDNFGNPLYKDLLYQEYNLLLFRMKKYDEIESFDLTSQKLVLLSKIHQRKFTGIDNAISKSVGQDDIIATLFGVQAPDRLLHYFKKDPHYTPLVLNRLYTNGNYDSIVNSYSNHREYVAKSLIAQKKFDTVLAQYKDQKSPYRWAKLQKEKSRVTPRKLVPDLFYSLSTKQHTDWLTNRNFQNTLPTPDRFDKPEEAFNFLNSSIYFQPNQKLNDSFTFSNWVNIHAIPPNRTYTLAQLTFDNGETFSINVANFQNSHKLNITRKTKRSNYSHFSHAEVTFGNWLHFAIVASTATQSYVLYINGQFDSYIPFDEPHHTTTIKEMYIGAQSKTVSISNFDGSLDDISIYNTALEPEEIKILYKK